MIKDKQNDSADTIELISSRMAIRLLMKNRNHGSWWGEKGKSGNQENGEERRGDKVKKKAKMEQKD